MKIAILGFDIEGRANYEYYSAKGHELTILDQKTDLDMPGGAESVLGENYLNNLDRFDMIVRTAGLPPAKILAKNPAVAGKITTQVNEFIKTSPTRNLIGVTGTKGKGTTSTLIAKMLEAGGKTVRLGGNIGTPPFSFINELDENAWVVLELSSFQLIDLKNSPHLAVCLMVAPEHLDWHADTDEYFIAKSQLFSHQNAEDIAIFYALNEASQKIASTSPGWKTPYMKAPGARIEGGNIVVDNQVICRTDELKLPGKHNWQNACAALTAAWKVSQNVEAFRSVLTAFTGLPHRLELVRELDGVKYYDDSFGTTPETAQVAVEAFKEPKVAILGGHPKGVPFDNLAETVAANKVRQVIAIGEAGPEITRVLHEKGFNQVTEGAQTMAEIVKQARDLARPGDVVLLSTACASFDMFKNYKDRAEQFISAVQALV
jgi:UDP-N-acetylmuramoylalanine--D-glutamate ligase